MSRNLLDQETSPYLLQHKDNPVHWRPWGKEALIEAERENKPLLVSVGYAACHWCHVMAHESFEDPETAELMNELYIPVKVDREERPDIDSWLQTAANFSGQSGGWPLNVFLTPKGEPFWGGTYFPKDDMFGRPAFKTVLRQIAARYRETPDDFKSAIERIGQVMDAAANQNRAGRIDTLTFEQITIATAQRFDVFFGGMTGTPKFPSLPSLKLLWSGYLRTAQPQLLQIVVTSLSAMCRGGIYDHVGGGFARYAVDERWLIPHFEKMLYDNAQFVDLLTLVWQNLRDPVHKTCVEDTIGWVLREMRVEGAGFASSLDADSEGEEGRYYTWTELELDAALVGTLIPRFKQAYGVTADGNFNGRNVLHRFISMGAPNDADEQLFAKQRTMLLAERGKRVPPLRDDKVLADWNGMMIASMARAGTAFRRADWLDAASAAFAFVLQRLSERDELYHTYRAGKRQHSGFSDDYANMARAALCLWEATGKDEYLERAKTWTKILNEKFWDPRHGGYMFSLQRDEPVNVRIRTAFDAQSPSSNGIMLEVLGWLYFATGDTQYSERINGLTGAFAGDVANAYMQMPTFLLGFEFCQAAIQIVVFGPNDDSRTHDLIGAALGRGLPHRVLINVAPGDALPQHHPAYGKTMQNGQPTAYICQNRVCSAPVTSPVTLSQVLQLPHRRNPQAPGPRPAANA